MLIIDADAHVIENETTWDYMLESERQLRPQIIGPRRGVNDTDYWLVDGRLVPRSNVGKELPVGAREMSDLRVRTQHMDDLGVDLQIIYPTFFIFPFTRRPEVELALCRSYNRWMAEIVAKAPDRFRWVVVPPLQHGLDHLAEELKLGKAQGACGVYMRGLEAERSLSDRYFFPLYEEAAKLDLPICIHSANGSLTVYDFFADDPGFAKFKLAVIGAFHSLIYHGIPQRFPRLKIGIIEVSSQWIPYAVHDLRRRFSRKGKELPRHLLRDNHVYVTCQTDDDLAHILDYADDDNLIIGSDYGHSDNASELLALKRLKEEGGLDPAVVDKILSANPVCFYGLDDSSPRSGRGLPR